MRRKKFFIVLFFMSLITTVSIFALIINIKTVPLVKESERLTKEIRLLEEQNVSLYFQIESQTTFEAMHEKAIKLGLKQLKPHEMEHVELNVR